MKQGAGDCCYNFEIKKAIISVAQVCKQLNVVVHERG